MPSGLKATACTLQLEPCQRLFTCRVRRSQTVTPPPSSPVANRQGEVRPSVRPASARCGLRPKARQPTAVRPERSGSSSFPSGSDQKRIAFRIARGQHRAVRGQRQGGRLRLGLNQHLARAGIPGGKVSLGPRFPCGQLRCSPPRRRPHPRSWPGSRDSGARPLRLCRLEESGILRICRPWPTSHNATDHRSLGSATSCTGVPSARNVTGPSPV